MDAAVHSLKDLPTQYAPGLTIAVIPERADARDILISPSGHLLGELSSTAFVGTSSQRRSAQLLAYRRDLSTRSIRGNVDTRIQKIAASQIPGRHPGGSRRNPAGIAGAYHAVPAPGYYDPGPRTGRACRAVPAPGDRETLRWLRPIEHTPTRLAVTAERAFLTALGGGCSLPVGAIARKNNLQIKMRGVVAAPDGVVYCGSPHQAANPKFWVSSLPNMPLNRAQVNS